MVEKIPERSINFNVQADAAAEIMARLNSQVQDAAARAGLKVIQGIGSLSDCVFVVFDDDPGDQPKTDEKG